MSFLKYFHLHFCLMKKSEAQISCGDFHGIFPSRNFLLLLLLNKYRGKRSWWRIAGKRWDEKRLALSTILRGWKCFSRRHKSKETQRKNVKEIKTERGFSVSCGLREEGKGKIVFCFLFTPLFLFPERKAKPKSTLNLYVYNSSPKSFLFVPFCEDIRE